MSRNCLHGSLLALFAMLVPGAPALASTAEGSDQQHVRLVLVRTAPGDASIDFSYVADTTYGPSSFGWVMARVQNGVVKSVQPGIQTSKAASDDPGVYAGQQSLTMCHTLGQCGLAPHTAGGIGGFDRSDDASGGNNVVFVAIDGASPTAIDWTVEASGWVVKQVPFESRFVEGTDPSADAIAVGSAYGGAELFTDAFASGGARGSIAQAMPPCANRANVRVGAGQVTLTGGVTEPSMTCPSTDQDAIADFATGTTTWDAKGEAAGDRTFAPTRLWVMDLPTGDGWYRPS